MATAVVVAVDEPRNAAPTGVPSPKINDLPAAALAVVLPLILLEPSK